LDPDTNAASEPPQSSAIDLCTCAHWSTRADESQPSHDSVDASNMQAIIVSISWGHCKDYTVGQTTNGNVSQCFYLSGPVHGALEELTHEILIITTVITPF
jgi:hypothetical protein